MKNDELAAFLFPSSRSITKVPAYQLVDEERKIAHIIADDSASTQTSVIVFGTTPYREQHDFDPRTIATSVYRKGTTSKLRSLESGRLVTSIVAAILEKAEIEGIPAVGYLVPREPVLSIETLDAFLNCVKADPLLKVYYQSLSKSKATWSTQAIKADEKESRKTEPEGMFM